MEGAGGLLIAADGIAKIYKGVSNLELDTEETRGRTPARGSNNDGEFQVKIANY